MATLWWAHVAAVATGIVGVPENTYANKEFRIQMEN